MSIESPTTATIHEQQPPSASRVVEDPALVVDWSVAIQQANLHRVQRLLRSHQDLLWTPLTAWDPERDASHVIAQLKTVQHLGSSLDNLCAIHYALLQYNEPVPGEKSTLAQLQTGNLLWFLIESATKQDLENQSWGNCNNRTLHLVSFLGHQQVARRLLDDKSVSTEIPNDLGFFARDVALSDDLFHLLSPINMDDDKRRLARSKHQYSSNNRFNQLRQLAETTPSANKNINSTRQAEGRYFRSGHVAESKRKVLSEEEAELEKQRLRRQQEVAMLAKRSAVKNNPLFKRFEQQQQQHKRTTAIANNTTVALSKSGSATEIASDNNNSNTANNKPTTDDDVSTATDLDAEPKKKRNSKVISALRNKSIVSSSVFLQTEPEKASSSSPAPPRSPQFTPSVEDSPPPPQPTIPSPKDNSAAATTTTTITKDADNVTQVKELSEEEATRMDRRRLSGSQKSQWALGMNSWASIMERSHLDTLSSDDDNVSEGEQWFDSKEFDADDIRNEVKQPSLHQNEPTQQPPIDNIDSTPARSSISSNFDTTPSSSPSSSSLSSPILESYPTSSSSISPASTITTTTTSPVQVTMERSPDHVHDDVSYGSISVSTTSRYVRRLSQAQNPALLELQHRQEQQQQQPYVLDEDTKQSKFKIKRVPVKVPPSVSKPPSSTTTKRHDPPTIRRSQSALQSLGSTVPASISLSKHPYQPKASRHGKLYLRINAATDMLLPLPSEPTYVRCVVSDDRYEYMSRYALLGQHIPFEYECIIDTNDDPDMIITISLHVRPDHHLRSKLPLTRLFSTNKKHHHHDKGSLSSYICHDDGSIGRSRFALSHMLHGCYMCSYSTRFDCFNAWTPQRQKYRSKEEGDVLKVIGSLEIEMLYLPLNDPSMSVPRNLRDCDMAIKIQQWNETCWNTENLTSLGTSKMADTTGSGLMKNLQPTRSPSLF